ncbi:MAG: DUF370 domain-containing protein [Eubacteriales bacterium]|nr:DUF370 domain-containing protein [Eubacteriales bacterium]
MYVMLGKDTVISEKNIIGIFDLDITSQSHLTRGYLSNSEKKGSVINAAEDIPRSFVVCTENRREKVYLSQMATSTLNKRIENDII